jgi:stage II sporulation protein R
MDGVFMKCMLKRVFFLMIAVCSFYTGALLADKQTLREELIRFHVVAASDSAQDQSIKLQVRDAVVDSLEQALADATDISQARKYILEHLPKIEAAANAVLQELGSEDRALVTFVQEAFPTREYDTFSLPAGIYESLRITIGDGEGKNWWCVVFPSLCMQSTSSDVADVAAGAGFSNGLSGAVSGKETYKIRFYFLDLIGKIENFFFEH